LEDEQGNEVKLKEGADVTLFVEADADATMPQTHRAKSQSEVSSFALWATLTLADYLSENLSTRFG